MTGPKDELKNEIRNIALNNHASDGYMWSLLKLARAVDKCFAQRGPLVGQRFNSGEWSNTRKMTALKPRFKKMTKIREDFSQTTPRAVLERVFIECVTE